MKYTIFEVVEALNRMNNNSTMLVSSGYLENYLKYIWKEEFTLYGHTKTQIINQIEKTRYEKAMKKVLNET